MWLRLRSRLWKGTRECIYTRRSVFSVHTGMHAFIILMRALPSDNWKDTQRQVANAGPAAEGRDKMYFEKEER
jgi:hypothetical protein